VPIQPCNLRSPGSGFSRVTPLWLLLEACHRWWCGLIFQTALPKAAAAGWPSWRADAGDRLEVDRGGHPRPASLARASAAGGRSSAVGFIFAGLKAWPESVAGSAPLLGCQCLGQRGADGCAKAGCRRSLSAAAPPSTLRKRCPSRKGAARPVKSVWQASASRAAAAGVAGSETAHAALRYFNRGLPPQWPQSAEEPAAIQQSSFLTSPRWRWGGGPISRSSA